MKMQRVFLCALCLVIIIATKTSLASNAEHASELVDPVDDVGETEEEDPAPRPIRASSVSSVATTIPGRRRARGRKNVGSTGGSNAGESVQRRRLAPTAYRTTRAPLFEASPPDPYIQSGVGGSEGHYGHSHSPPTRDPYYSPSKFERDRKRQRIKLASEAPLVPLPQNSFDHPGPAVLSNPRFQKPGKNYAFAYAVGDDSEDFSHKQAKDGGLTIGEYRITLPDGRTQVVRYTAGGKHGYKADVTYEGADPNSKASPAGFAVDHGQYHQSVQPTHHLSATPSSSFNNNRVIKSRPLKTVALHSNEDIEYSPPSQEVEYQPPPPHPSPKIKLKAGGHVLPSPSPTVEFLNGISSTTPTPRPNSIYDKISPYRGGKYSGSEELAYAHEHSPRAGPHRSKSKQVNKQVSTTAAAYYDSPSPSPFPHKANVHPTPTKKYKNPGGHQYVGGHQPQANHVNEYIRPQKHIQYLQESPIHHQHLQPHRPTPLIAKPVKEHGQHLVPLDHYKPDPFHNSYSPPVHKTKKHKKNKHGIHNPLGQYLLQAPVTVQTPVKSYQPTGAGYISKEPFHYYNSFHSPHHHGYGQISASPSPVTSVSHSESPLPNAYPVSVFPTGASIESPNQPRLRLPEPPSTAGHVYLETPASGERPSRLRIKEALARLPSRDLVTPKTTIHPYEVGAVDYGKGVAYGNAPQDKGFPDGPYNNYGGHSGFDNLDPTNSLFNSVTSPATTGGGIHHHDGGYYPNDVPDQFNFLDGFHNFDIEQANVREIRQPRPTRANVGGRLSRRVNRRPEKRRGVPVSDSSKEAPSKSTPPSSSPRPTGRQRQRHQQVRTSSPRSVKPSHPPPSSRSPSSTTSKAPPRGRRRRMRTQPPVTDPMMHAVESRRPRTRSRNNN